MDLAAGWSGAVRTKWALAALAVVAALCGIAVLVGTADGPEPAAPAAPATWATLAAEVVGVRRADDHAVVIVASLPAGRADCAKDLRIEMLQEREPDQPDVVYANVVFSSAASATVGACPDRHAAEVVMRVADPLGERTLMLNSVMRMWAPTRGPGYRQCDEVLGCHPPTDHCDPLWIDHTVLGMDVAVKRVRSVRDVLACDGTWLVLDLNRAAGNCPPAEGAPSCDIPPSTNRVFLRFERDRWESVAGGQEAGCAPVRPELPAFPEKLCRDLPAPG
jgi:hypothetical protein